jgi:hypothetical protein
MCPAIIYYGAKDYMELEKALLSKQKNDFYEEVS